MDLDEPDKQKKTSNDSVDTMHVLQSDGVRCVIQNCNGVDRFLLDYGLNILPYITIISWGLSLLI